MEVARRKRFGFKTSRALGPNWFLPTRFSQLVVVLLLAIFLAFLLLPPRDHGTSSSCWRFCSVGTFLGVFLCQWIFTLFLPSSLRLLIQQKIGMVRKAQHPAPLAFQNIKEIWDVSHSRKISVAKVCEDKVQLSTATSIQNLLDPSTLRNLAKIKR